MDPSLIVHHPITTTVPTNHHNLPGSAESTPRSANQADCWGDDPLPQVPGAKLRLMCSYGGHIIPRPHDKSLCYMGGETRMVTVDRSSCLSDLCTRLSRSLLDGRRFTPKYQLPNEELDSLISLATDEDLENMIEEYDRLMAKPMGGGRLRLFLFLAKPDTAKTMGVLLDDAKSETWFVDALNGADILNINRGLSDSAAIDDLLSLDSGVSEPNSTHQAHAQVPPPVFSESDAVEQPQIAPQQEKQSIQYVMPDSPMVETTTSSSDSSSPSPSMAHLPPIRVKVDEGGEATRPLEEMKEGALEEQFFSQLRVTPRPTAILTPAAAVTNERSDHAAPVLSRKPPLPLPLQPMHQTSGGFNLTPPDFRHAGNFDLPSPDSVESDSSIASTASLSKVPASQDQGAQLPAVKPNIDLKTESPVPTTQNQATILQPTQDPNTYMYQYPPPNHQQDPQNQQTQFIQPPNMQYIPAHNPIQSYYHPLYPTQQPIHPHQQSPMYLLPVTQTQAYNLASVQDTESTAVPTSSAPQAPTPFYPTNPGGLIQVASNSGQFQQQYVGYSTAARPVAVSAAHYGNYNYGHDHQQQQQQHVYYTGQMVASRAIPVVGSQYQSISPAQAAMVAEASMQLPTTDSNKQPPRVS
ncbi:hypothetical protein Cgig2_021604 [Carnegiea gigantea]|uniref:PB1 domain-containing protein n=1 Tax=Carnegiea gigantea TaxID=171969 RepID=A0A9Q1GJU9_9CARY|nr:hypothetical protein Cgig2_021604 [Carnegiea gigantea]